MEHVHLSELEYASNAGKKLEVNVIITGKGEALQVPSAFYCQCTGYEISTLNGQKQIYDGCKGCPFYGQGKTQTLQTDDPLYYKIIHQTNEQVAATIKRHLAASTPIGIYDECRKSLRIEFIDIVLVRPVQIAPKVSKIAYDNDMSKAVDESGREYKELLAYVVGDCDLSMPSYTFHGMPFSRPATQEVAFWVNNVTADHDLVDNFCLTETIKSELEHFLPTEPTVKSIDDKFNAITKAVTCKMTNIYGKNHERHALGAALLTYASPKELYFDEQFLPRASLNILIVGDTGQGKSKMIDNLISSLGLGIMVNGGAAGRTGMLYNLDAVQYRSRMLRWGVMPLNTGRLVVVDEAQRFSIEEWAEMTRARSEGKIEVHRSKHGEHEMKTRLLFIANPKDNRTGQYRQVGDYVFGIEAAKIMNDQDLRRFDVVVIIATGDASVDEVNRLRADNVDRYDFPTVENMRNWVCWVWSKKYHQRDIFVYHNKAEEKIVEVSQRLISKYRADGIPLLIEDTKEKVARLSAAISNLVPTTIDDKVHITPQHVEWVEMWLNSNYSHPSSAFDKYAAKQRATTTLSETEYDTVLNEVNGLKDGCGMVLISQFDDNEVVATQSLAECTGLKISTLQNNYLPVLRNLGLIRSRKGGYARTPKLVKFLRQQNTMN